MSLADRLAAARESRADGLVATDELAPGEGLPETDHAIPAPVSPVDSAVAAAEASHAGKRRADVPAAVGSGTAPGSRSTSAPPDTSARRGLNTAQNDRIEDIKS